MTRNSKYKITKSVINKICFYMCSYFLYLLACLSNFTNNSDTLRQVYVNMTDAYVQKYPQKFPDLVNAIKSKIASLQVVIIT